MAPGQQSADCSSCPHTRPAEDDKPVLPVQDKHAAHEPSRWSVGRGARSTGSMSLARLCSDFMTLSEDDLTERDDIFNTCDELNDFLLNDLTDDSDMTREQ